MQWARRGLVEGLAGCLFGVFVSLAIVIALALDFDWARRIEQQGIDWSTRLGLFLPDSQQAHNRAAAGANATIVFLDVDTASCRAFVRPEHLCLTDRIGHPALLNAVGDALRTSGAHALILDFRTPEVDAGGSADAEAMLDAWARGDGPLVIAALPAAPTEGSTLAIDWSAVPGGAAVAGRLRYATPVIWGGGIEDGTIRHYPLIVEIDQFGARSGVTWLPSLPFAAALYARAGTAGRSRVDCVLYEHPDPAACRGAQVEWNELQFGDLSALRTLVEQRQVEDVLWGERFLFSYPSQVPVNGKAPFSGSLIGRFEYRTLSGYLREGRLAIPPGAMADMIVVVGSSAAVSRDWHATPLGRMTGAELVANATRAFAAYPPMTEPGLMENLGLKLLFTCLAAAIMTLAWLGIEWIRERQAADGTRVRHLVRFRRTALKLAIFAAAVGALLGLVLVEGAVLLGYFAERGRSVDVLFPVLAVLIETFVDFAQWLVKRLERLASWIIDRLHAIALLAKQLFPGSRGAG